MFYITVLILYRYEFDSKLCPQLRFIHIHQLFIIQYTCSYLDAVNIYIGGYVYISVVYQGCLARIPADGEFVSFGRHTIIIVVNGTTSNHSC